MYEDRNVFGLTGGMGSGKSTVSAELANLGAVVVDADKIVHEIQAPGMPILADMQELLGDDIVRADGSLDRKLAAERIFASAKMHAALNELITPVVFAEMNERIAATSAHEIVVLDAPLLVEYKPDGLKGILVVDTPVETAVQRILANRETDEADARRRIANQISYEERLAHADYIIPNHGEAHELMPEVAQAWRWMQVVTQNFAAAAVRSVVELPRPAFD